jgi:hypothetical protein
MAQVSRHLLSTRPLPSTGDTVAMFDLERKLFLTATKSHNVKLTAQGEFLNEVRAACRGFPTTVCAPPCKRKTTVVSPLSFHSPPGVGALGLPFRGAARQQDGEGL